MKSDTELAPLGEAMFTTIRQPLLVLGSKMQVERANPAFYDLFNVAPDQTLGQTLYDLGNGQWNIRALRHLLDVIQGGEERTVENFKVEHEFEDIGRRIMLLNASRIEGEGARPHLILLAIDDVTDRERARLKLEEQKRFAETMIVTVRQPLLVLNSELRVERANPAFYDLFKVAPEQTLGRLIYELGNRQWEIPALRQLFEAVVGGEECVESYRVAHEFEDIGPRVMLLNARRMEGEDARPHLILLAINDITDLEQARFELEGQKEYTEKLIDSVRESLIVLGWDLRVKHANKTFYDLFQVPPEETQGRMIYDLGNGQWNIPELRLLLEDILPKEYSFDDYEVVHDFETIGRRTMLLNARRLDHLDLILLAIRDMTEKLRIEAQQHATMGELQHRVKNILANVRAVFTLARRQSMTAEDFAASFEDRLAALARTQDLLLSKSSDSVTIGELVKLELAAHARDEKKVVIEGPAVELPSRLAQAVSMAVHELVTNAAKYGALSRESGSIEVEWRTEERDGKKYAVFQWREHGVPIQTAVTKKGFGSQIIEHTLPYALAGVAQLTFHSDGAECIIEFPISEDRDS